MPISGDLGPIDDTSRPESAGGITFRVISNNARTVSERPPAISGQHLARPDGDGEKIAERGPLGNHEGRRLLRSPSKTFMEALGWTPGQRHREWAEHSVLGPSRSPILEQDLYAIWSGVRRPAGTVPSRKSTRGREVWRPKVLSKAVPHHP